jgi:protein-tyrosine-phosphatase
MNKIVIDSKVVEAPPVRICLLYDKTDGRIIHGHKVLSFSKTKLTDKDIEARALALAKQLGKDISNVKALHVQEKDFDQSAVYKVDTKKGTLVKVEAPQRPNLHRKL